LTNLHYLYLSSNQLSGSIPPQLGNLTRLAFLYLNYNQLSGPLPQSLTNLRSLSWFYFDADRLCAPGSGAFQAWLGGIPNKPSGITACQTWYLPQVRC
jgi:hypothetical protein